jgi:hypothetical protein
MRRPAHALAKDRGGGLRHARRFLRDDRCSLLQAAARFASRASSSYPLHVPR